MRISDWSSDVCSSDLLVVLLRGHFAQHLRAHVLELVLELDLLGDGDAVLGNARSAEALLDHDIAALGTERDLYCIRKRIRAAQHAIPRVRRKRSEERSVGKGCVSTCRSRGSPSHK